MQNNEKKWYKRNAINAALAVVLVIMVGVVGFSAGKAENHYRFFDKISGHDKMSGYETRFVHYRGEEKQSRWMMRILSRTLRGAEVTEKQREQIIKILNEELKDGDDIRTKFVSAGKGLLTDLIEVMEKEEIKKADIENIRKTFSQKVDNISQNVANIVFEISEVLTLEQRKKIADRGRYLSDDDEQRYGRYERGRRYHEDDDEDHRYKRSRRYHDDDDDHRYERGRRYHEDDDEDHRYKRSRRYHDDDDDNDRHYE